MTVKDLIDKLRKLDKNLEVGLMYGRGAMLPIDKVDFAYYDIEGGNECVKYVGLDTVINSKG